MSQGIKLAIGITVNFHSRAFAPFHRARVAIVTGVGADPMSANLTVLPDALLDVANSRHPPIVTRRSVPIYTEYPDNWPMGDFAVFPPTANAFLVNNPTWKPRGGVLPEILACITRPARVDGIPATDQVASPTPERVLTKEELDGVDAREPAAAPTTVPDAPPPAAKGQKAEDDPADHAIRKLLSSPPWDRNIGESLIPYAASGDTIRVRNKAGTTIATISHETAKGPRQGYKLIIDGREIIHGARDINTITRMMGIVGELATVALDVTDGKALAKILKKAKTVTK